MIMTVRRIFRPYMDNVYCRESCVELTLSILFLVFSNHMNSGLHHHAVWKNVAGSLYDGLSVPNDPVPSVCLCINKFRRQACMRVKKKVSINKQGLALLRVFARVSFVIKNALFIHRRTRFQVRARPLSTSCDWPSRAVRPRQGVHPWPSVWVCRRVQSSKDVLARLILFTNINRDVNHLARLFR